MLRRARLRHPSGLLPMLLLATSASAQIVFEPPVTTELSHTTQGVIRADVNLDGHTDIVTLPRFPGAFQNPQFSVLLGHGDGTFAPAVTTTIVGEDSSRGSIALLDGDAFPDIVLVHNVTGNDDLSIYSGAGDGSFRVALDMAVPNGGTIVDVVPVDLSGDGKLDLVMLSAGFVPFFPAKIIVAAANGSGGYPLQNNPNLKAGSDHFALGDVDGDGLLDAVITCPPSGTLTVEIGRGGNFEPPVHQTVGGAPSGLVLVDLDADGALDVAYADPSGNQVVSLRGDGAGHFALLQGVAVPGGPTELSAGPLDPGGALDLLVSDAGSSELTVLRGAGDGTLAAVTTISHVPTPGGSTLADFDEDGVVDAAVGTAFGTLAQPGKVEVLRNHTYAAGSPFTDLGHALAGSNGYPILLAGGTLAAGSPGELDLDGAAPGAGGNLWLGLGQLNKPFKGGVFVPLPLLPIPFLADGAGHAALPFIFPAGVPVGTTLVFQFWIADAGAVHGYASSSGLQGVTP